MLDLILELKIGGEVFLELRRIFKRDMPASGRQAEEIKKAICSAASLKLEVILIKIIFYVYFLAFITILVLPIVKS